MTALAAAPSAAGRLLRRVADLAVGGLLCCTPVTALLALGWISRATAASARGAARPGWLLGARGSGWVGRIGGGLAANIRAGITTLAGLGLWTLPFGLLWLSAWWAGWENSFNKGYEQAAVGPLVFLLGLLVALPALTLLPMAAAHGAAEGRLSAYAEVRTIVRRTRIAGWRGLALAVLALIAALPLFAYIGLPVFVEEWAPGFAALDPAAQAEIAGTARLAAALWSFAALWALREMAMRLYLRPGPPRLLSWVWMVLSAAVWLGLFMLVFLGQFLNYAPERWLTHPFTLLPFPG